MAFLVDITQPQFDELQEILFELKDYSMNILGEIPWGFNIAPADRCWIVPNGKKFYCEPQLDISKITHHVPRSKPLVDHCCTIGWTNFSPETPFPIHVHNYTQSNRTLCFMPSNVDVEMNIAFYKETLDARPNEITADNCKQIDSYLIKSNQVLCLDNKTYHTGYPNEYLECFVIDIPANTDDEARVVIQSLKDSLDRQISSH